MSTTASSALLRLLNVQLPLLLSPMAGVANATLAIAIARAGGLGAIPAATLSPQQLHEQVQHYRAAVAAPLNINFFAHQVVEPATADIERWAEALQPLHAELALEVPRSASAGRQPFDAQALASVQALRPEVVSFHFGLPAPPLLEAVKATGAIVLSSATTVAEARWLARNGADAVIAQGWEAGGHRAMFLDDDIDGQVGTMALVPQIVDAVDVPVIAAGGIADGRGMAAALLLGAAAVQIGTAFLRTPEATTSAVHRQALALGSDSGTRLTNVFTGRPARGLLNRMIRELGPMSTAAPAFPYAGSQSSALRAYSQAHGDGDFISLWAGQSAALAQEAPAEQVVAGIVEQARRLLPF